MKKIIIVLLSTVILVGCTKEFEKFDEQNNRDLTQEFVSARFFFPDVQIKLLAPPGWNYFFGRMVYSRSYGGYMSYGNKGHWEESDAPYDITRAWGADGRLFNVHNNYVKTITGFLRLVEPGGEFENPLMEAVGLIMKSYFYSTYTDIFGEVAYTEAGVEGILAPKYDPQEIIYKGIIADLDAAMATIGDASSTGVGVEDLGEFDFIMKGDLQKWKSFTNGVKLRVALRAKGAPGENFADKAISEALANPLPTSSVRMKKDLTVPRGIADRVGFYSRFGFSAAAMMSIRFTDILRDNNDPRLSKMAEPIPGGEIIFEGYNVNEDVKKSIDWVLANTLDHAGVGYTATVNGDNLDVSVEGGDHYVGQPNRLSDAMKTYLNPNLFSRASNSIEDHNNEMKERDTYIMPLAEVYFMQAEAALLGFGGDAQALLTSGIEASFEDWGTEDNGYLSSPIATLSGSKEEQLQTLGLQSWIALFYVDHQGFAVARDFKLEGITDDLPNDPNLYRFTGDLQNKFPQRMPYPQGAYDANATNIEIANGRQGPDNNATELWFAKGSK